MLGGMGLKTCLVLSQLCGYMVAKFAGVRIVSEMPKSGRAVSDDCPYVDRRIVAGRFCLPSGRLQSLDAVSQWIVAGNDFRIGYGIP